MPSDELPDQRASDAEREQLVAILREHAAEGRLTTDELEERSSVAYAAATRGELVLLRRDLPEPSPSAAAQSPAAATVPDRLSAVLGSFEQGGHWRVPEQLSMRVILGNGRLDLRQAEIPAEVHIEARVRLGELTILVPENARVELTGKAVLGERKVRGRPGAGAGGPVIRIHASVVLGNLKVDVATIGERVRGYLRPGA